MFQVVHEIFLTRPSPPPVFRQVVQRVRQYCTQLYLWSPVLSNKETKIKCLHELDTKCEKI